MGLDETLHFIRAVQGAVFVIVVVIQGQLKLLYLFVKGIF